tara:strand:+ start:730 stop:1566 length:837 start_codon:yes stop_codon:yes gene_type:complete
MSSAVDFQIKKFSIDQKKHEVCVPIIPQDDFFANYMSLAEPYEYTMLVDMASHLNDGDHVLDIGGHIGNHSLYLAAHTKANITIFEPNPLLYPHIEASIAKNNFNNRINLIKKGVGEKAGFAQFEKRIEENIGMQSLAVSESQEDGIEIISIDEMMDTLPEISLMKIDVEGMEMSVLKGSIELIKKYKPLIYIECRRETDYVPVHNWMSEVGYVWCDTFNATPTHLYRHSSTMSSEQRIECMINKAVKESYYKQQQINELIAKLRQMDAALRQARGMR